VSLFDALQISGSGVQAMQTWIDTTSGNIANSNDTVVAGQSTYAEQTPVFTPLAPSPSSATGEGVQVSGIALGATNDVVGAAGLPTGATGAQGASVAPDISLSNQFVELMEAQNSYAADTSAMNKAISAYQSGLTIGT
jgi:flagellar basal body rod protein FlgC